MPGELFSSPRERLAGARLLAVGSSVGEGCVSGRGRYVASADDLSRVQPGDIVLAERVKPEWRSCLSAAAALVVDRDDGGELPALGLPAVVHAGVGASPLWTGAKLTVIAEPNAPGRVYQQLTRLDGQAPRRVIAFS
jgi:pyruvate,water dikinase